MRDTLQLNIQSPAPIPGGPVVLDGPFVAWLYLYRVASGDLFIIGDRREDGTGAMVHLYDGTLTLASLALGGYHSGARYVPTTGDVLLRIRRDENNDIYFAFTGEAEFAASGPTPSATTLEFDSFNTVFSTDDSTVYESDDSAFTREVRIVSGTPTNQEMADYETALTGAAL